MKKNAVDMFEKLGFHLTPYFDNHGNELCFIHEYVRFDGIKEDTIVFNDSIKIIYANSTLLNKNIGCFILYKELHIAIHQQLKELGWL